MEAAEQFPLQPTFEIAEAPLAAAPEQERRFIREMGEGDRVAGVFAVRERSRMTRRSGEDFLKLIVADKTGSVEAVAWEEIDALFALTAPGQIVRIEGPFTVHPRYGAKVTIQSLRSAESHEYEAAELSEVSPVPVERMETDLRDLVETIHDRDLRELLDRFLGEGTENWRRFREAPAAKYYHQAYTHGLLEHSLTVAQAVSAAAAFFPGIDRETAVTGALLHDFGKTEAYNSDPLAIDLTDAGRLLGEIPIGYYRVRREIESIEGFDPARAQAVLHVILSHHGKLENGSPVVPATREALLVHMMDNLGGTLGSFDRLERELPDGQSWSKFDRGLDSAAFFGKRDAA